MVCYLNRNLRYGNSDNRFLQYMVIRSRFYLQKIIRKNSEFIRSSGLKKIKLAHAGNLELQLNDYIDMWLYTGADFEPHTVSLFRKILKTGDNALDIGANIGYLSLIASNIVGSSGKIYAFEPTPETIIKFKKNLALNNCSNIILYQTAVSETNGTAVFRIPSDEVKNSGRASLRDIEENNFEIKVETTRLDSMLEDLPTIQLVKMDIEGAEAMALKGMEQLINRDRPLFIMELSGFYLQQLSSSSNFVIEFFKKKHYRILVTGDIIYEINNVKGLKNAQYDILCIPGEKYDVIRTQLNKTGIQIS